MTAGRSRGKVWRACASAWAQLPPSAVQAGDRVVESVVRDALQLAVRFLSNGSGKDPSLDVLQPEWVKAAVATVSKDSHGLIGYEDFLDIVEQYWDLAALAGSSAVASVVGKQVVPVVPVQTEQDGKEAPTEPQTEQDAKEAQVERLCAQAFLWVDPEGVEAVSVSQAKTALAFVFNCIGVPNPPDEWHNMAFQNFDEDADGLIEFEEMHEIALQHCELIWEGGLAVNPAAAVASDSLAPDATPAGAPLGSSAPTSCIDVLASVLQEQGKASDTLDKAMLSKDECRQMIAHSLRRVPGSTLPPDQWCDLAFGNYDEDGDGLVTGEDAADILEEWLTACPPQPGKDAAETTRTPVSPSSQSETAKEVFSPPARVVSQDSGMPVGQVHTSYYALPPDSDASVPMSKHDVVSTADVGSSTSVADLSAVPSSEAPNSTAGAQMTTALASQASITSEAQAQSPCSSSRDPAESETGATAVAVDLTMAAAASRKSVAPKKNMRFDSADPVTHEIPEVQRSSATTAVTRSTASSMKSEVFDIYSVGTASTTPPSTAFPQSRRSIGSRRKTVVPVAAQIMTPAYSGQLRVFVDYTFMEEKGGGAFGRVMRVEHKRMHLQRACKAVAIRGARQFELVETEVALMRKLDHPNVLRLFESYYDGDRNIYIIIELCSGGSLSDRMEACKKETGGGMPEAQAASALRDTLTALQYCHRKGVIHRDIKPDNLLYVCKDADSTLKVIDFGLSDFLAKIEQKAQEGQKEDSQKDKKKRAAPRIGTPHFMAAEVYLEGIYDERVDTFACGVVLAEALTGVHPFFELGKDNLESIRTKILTGKVEFQAPHWDPVTPLAKELAGHLLDPDRYKRFDAAQALAHLWLARNKTSAIGERADVKRQIFDGLIRFRDQNVLKQAASRVLAKLLDDNQLAALQLQFQLLDADGSGSISAAELQEGARCCGRQLEFMQVQEILQGFDRIQSNEAGAAHTRRSSLSGAVEIYYTDFLAALLEYGVTLKEVLLREVYLRFSDGKDKISWNSLETAIRAATAAGLAPAKTPPCSVPASGVGEDATQLELRQVFEEVGDADGCINFTAFSSMWVPQESI